MKLELVKMPEPDAVSPPARGRGLKRQANAHIAATQASPPARGRGLKHLKYYLGEGGTMLGK